MERLTTEHLNQFFNLAVALEPENLHMDGEATKRQAAARMRQIERAWTKLEKSIGQRVRIDDVWAAKLGQEI
tara:strand:- start:239 stop:454 length:216 start_codon:yes stop_codon:yes gene_type:complete